MREYYHRAMANIFAGWRVVANIPTALRWTDEDFSSTDMLRIVKRASQSKYYDKHAEQQACGCWAIGNHFTSYLMDCEEHGWDAIFPDIEEEE